MLIEINEHHSRRYGERTKKNVDDSDLTMAVAINYTSRGEELTKKLSIPTYIAIPYHVNDLDAIKKKSRMLYRACRYFSVRTLNIAGNSLKTFRDHLNMQGGENSYASLQDDINDFMFQLLLPVSQHYPIQKIVTGGQTGADIAGAIAGVTLGIPVVVTMPKGFLQRDENGQDFQQNKEDVYAQIARGMDTLAKKYALPSPPDIL